jgi:uncharacterized integral membrane protein
MTNFEIAIVVGIIILVTLVVANIIMHKKHLKKYHSEKR